MNEKNAHGVTPKKKKQTSLASGDRLTHLVSRAKRGNVEAFQELYQIYGKKILNYIYRMTGSREEAEDLTQDTFILAHKNLSALKEDAKFQSWLFRIAQNSVYQHFRARTPPTDSIDQPDTERLAEMQPLVPPSKSPQGRLMSMELQQVIENAIDNLPHKYREVFVLSAIQKVSYQEISDILGRSLASVKSDIHRARVEVRNEIREYLGENYGMSNLL